MEQVLINISDALAGDNLKAFLQKQKGLEFKVFSDLKTRKSNQIKEIIALSDLAQNENSGIDWGKAKEIIRSNYLNS